MRSYLIGITAALALAAATVAAYWPVFRCGFVNYDDNVFITENPNVLKGLTWEGVRWAFTSTTEAVNWHPLTWLSFQLDAQLWGKEHPSPFGFHLTNVILHVVNTLLLFWALTRMTGRMGRSAFTAALFALHPLHVESVAWITERKDVLSGLFWMLATIGYVHYAARPRWWTYLVTVAAFALGLMAKSMVVTLPCVFLLLDYWPLRRFPGQGDRHAPPAAAFPTASWRRLTVEKIPLLLLAAASCAITMFAQKQGGDYNPVATQAERIEIALTAYATYVGKTLWPTGLIPFYPTHPDRLYPYWIEAAALLAGVTVLTLLLARRRPYLLVGWLWFLGTLAPVIGVIPVIGGQAMADRYTYVPLIGLFIALVWAAADVASGEKRTETVSSSSSPSDALAARRSPRAAQTALAAVGLALLAACMVGTWEQVGYWHDSIALWQHALDVDPRNHLAYNNIGHVRFTEGKYAEAERYFRRATECDNPWHDPLHFGLSHYSLAWTLWTEGRPDEAIVEGEHAVRLLPSLQDYQHFLGWMLLQRSRPAEAVAPLEAAVKEAPDSTRNRLDLAWALYLVGRYAEAEGQYKMVVKQEPNSAAAHNFLGRCLMARNDAVGAAAEYEAALRIDPDYADAHANMAAALWALGQEDAARRQDAEAQRLRNPE